MEKLFVPYEIALKLKEWGFDQACFGFYDLFQNKVRFNVNGKMCYYQNTLPNFTDGLCTAPLYQQVVDWFREKHKLEVSFPAVASTKSFKWVSYITSIEKDNDLLKYTKNYKDYYECLNKSIEEALKLI